MKKVSSRCWVSPRKPERLWPVEAALKKKQAELLIAAEDINPKRLEHWQRAAKENGVKIVSAGTQEQNGAAMGLSARAIVAVNDRQMKEAILARIE